MGTIIVFLAGVATGYLICSDPTWVKEKVSAAVDFVKSILK